MTGRERQIERQRDTETSQEKENQKKRVFYIMDIISINNRGNL